MKTILNIPASSRTLRFPNGYRVMGTLQPLGEIAPGIFHLEIREDPPPGHDAATQYLRKLPGVQDGNAWRIAWEIVEIPPPEPPMAITPRQMRLALLARGITPATITDALTVLRLSASDDYSGMTVRYADQMGDAADLADCEAAAKVLGLTLTEDEDGALVVE